MQITKENLTIIIVTIKSQNIIDDCLVICYSWVSIRITRNNHYQEYQDYLQWQKLS